MTTRAQREAADEWQLSSFRRFVFHILPSLLFSHQRKASGDLFAPVGRIGVVEERLKPEGSVLIGGELWRACARGEWVARGERVRVVAARGVLLEVAPLRD